MLDRIKYLIHKARPALILVGGAGVGAILSFGIQVMLARVLGVAGFGEFSAVFVLMNMLSPLAGFGVAGFLLSVYGKEGPGARRWLPGVIFFLILSSTAVLGVAMLWSALGPHSKIAAVLLMVMSTLILGQLGFELTSIKYQIESRYEVVALWQCVQHILRAVGLLLVVVIFDEVEVVHVAVIFSLVAVVIFLYSCCQIGFLLKGRVRLVSEVAFPKSGSEVDGPSVWKAAMQSWPFGISAIMFVVYYQSDILLVKYMLDESAAGVYQVAFLVMSIIYLFPSVVYQKFFLPKMHQWAYHNSDMFLDVYRRGNYIMFILGLCSMVGLYFLAPYVISIVFGVGYERAGDVLKILAFALPFRFVSYNIGTLMMTGGMIISKVKIMTVVASLNVFFSVIFIPFYGVKGAAFTTVVSEALLVLMYFIAFRKVARFS